MAMGKQSDINQYCVVMLDKSGTSVEVKRKRLELILRDRSRTPEKTVEHADETEKKQRKPLKWVREGLLVRCVSKSVHSGSLYNKELIVSGVLSEFAFEVKADGKVIIDLRERDVETVLPSSSQLATGRRIDCLIVRGVFKGRAGKILQIDKKRDVVDVQIEHVKVEKVGQDDVCCVAN